VVQRQVPPGELVTSTEFGDHGFLSDCISGLLVDSRGSVEWLCLQRFDSPFGPDNAVAPVRRPAPVRLPASWRAAISTVLSRWHAPVDSDGASWLGVAYDEVSVTGAMVRR